MTSEFEIQKALIEGDAKRAELLKTILKLKEQGITVSEKDFQNNEQTAAAIDKQLEAAKKRLKELEPAKQESDKAQQEVTRTQQQIKTNNQNAAENLKRQKSNIGTFSVNQGEIDKYEQARQSLIRENDRLKKQKSSAQSTVDRNKAAVKEYQELEQRIKELESQRGRTSAIQAAKDQMKKAAEQKTELDKVTIDKMGREDTASVNLQVARLQGNQDQIRELELINELKQKGIITDEKDIDRIRQKYEELLKIKKANEQTLNQAKVNKDTSDTMNQNQILEAQLRGDYDRVNTLKLINQLKAQGVNIDEQELRNNRQKYQQLIDQQKMNRQLNFRNSWMDQAKSLEYQAMRQAGFAKEAAKLEAVRNAEKRKGDKLTQKQKNLVEDLAELQYKMSKISMEKPDFSRYEIKTNQLTARGGFATGAVVADKDKVNNQIKNYTQQITSIVKQIRDLVQRGNII